MITRGNYTTLGLTELLEQQGYRTLGYSWLCSRYGIDTLSPIACNVIAKDMYEYNHKNDDPRVNLVRPGSYFDQEYDVLGTAAHIMYAVAGELFNPYILKKVFSSLGREDKMDIEEALNEAPENVVNRKVGYMYEKFTGKELDFRPSDRMAEGKKEYEKLLSSNIYYTLSTNTLPAHRINQKYRIYDNALGDLDIMCPMVRRSRELDLLSERNYGSELLDVFKKTEPDILDDVKNIMFMKESMMSFKVEGEEKASARIRIYEDILRENQYGIENFSKNTLVNMQNKIVSAEKSVGDYRGRQNFVGSMGQGDSVPTIDFVPPKPEDVDGLMSGVISMHAALGNDRNIDPVVAGSIMHGAFVVVHPFEDGNGRISRCCFHDMLAVHDYVPGGAIFPVSDIISQNKNEYTKGLANVTYNIIKACDFDFDENGCFIVRNNDADLYRYLDMTPFAESMYRILAKTMDETVPDILDSARILKRVRSAIDKHVPYMTERQKNRYLKLSLSDDEGRVYYHLKRRVFNDIKDEDLERLQTETKKIILEFNRLKEQRFEEEPKTCMEPEM